MNNIKAFLEAKKLQNPEDAALFILTAHMAQDEIRAMLTENERLNTLLSIREAAYDMDNKAGKEIERLTEQNAAMQDVLEQVCEAIDSTVKSGSYAYLDKRIRDRLMDALTAAAPYRKGVV